MLNKNLDSKITITGRHFHTQPALTNYAFKKAQKLIHHFEHIEHIAITMDRDKAHRTKQTVYEVNIRISIPGKNLNLSDEGPNMRQTLDSAINRLDRELVKTKEKIKTKHRRAGVRKLPNLLRRVKIKRFRRPDDL